MKFDYFYEESLLIHGTLNEKKNQEYLDTLYENKYEYSVRPAILLHRLFNSNYFNIEQKNFSTKDAIAMLLLHHSFITVPQIEFLKLYPSNRTISVMLSKFQQGKKLLVASEKSFDNKVKIYTLEEDNRPSLCFTLPERYVDDMKLYEKARYDTASLSFLHDVLLLNNYYYLLGEFSFPTFAWYAKPFLPYYQDNLKGIIDSIESYTKEKDTSLSMRPDAAIIFNEDSVRKIIYVEEDMCTERRPILQKKMDRYLKVLRMRSKNLLNESLLFSIYNESKVAYNSLDKKTTKTIPFTYSKALKLCNIMREYASDLKTESLADIEGEIDFELFKMEQESELRRDMNQTKVNKNRMDELKQCMDLIARTKRHDKTNDRIEDCIKVINNIRSDQDNMRRENKESINYKAIKKRYRTIVDAIKDTTGFHELLLKGLSVYVIDTMFPMQLEYAMLSSFHSYEVLYESYLRYRYNIFIRFSDEYSYKEYNIFQYGERKFLLKNVLFTNNREDVKPIAIENISHDVGAYFRVKRYLSSQEVVNKCPLNLILLVHEIEDAIRLYEELELKNYYIPGEPKKSFCATYITFCDYKNVYDTNSFFVLDPEHNVITI